MPKPTAKGEFSVRLGGVELDLRYKTKNLRVLSEILGGKSPFDLLKRLEHTDGDATAMLTAFADPGFLLPALAAGLAHHAEYSRDTVSKLLEKLESMIDREVDSSDRTPLEVYSRLGSQVMLPFIAAIAGNDAFGGEDVGKLRAALDAAFDGEATQPGET